jgi:hypothetical protein
MPTSQQRREELSLLAEKATPLPWFRDSCAIASAVSQGTCPKDRGVSVVDVDAVTYFDADYIAAACNALPALLADLTAAERERDHWKANHDEMVARNRLFRGRPDLTPEQYAQREGIWARLKRAERENSELREKLKKLGA